MVEALETILIDLPILKSLVTLSSVIEARDSYTGGHIWRVSQYSKLLAKKTGLEEREIFLVELGGLVHDIGKIGISDTVLNKRDKLSFDEFNVMKRHTELGKNLIDNHPLAPLVLDAVYNHHERVDGKGYPNARNNEELSIVSRIVSIADAFDAMTSARPYRNSMPLETAFRIINDEKAKQFDSYLAEVFVNLGETSSLDWIHGHCGESNPMLSCPGCGPIIAPSVSSQGGDSIVCPSCKGTFTMHPKGGTYELECKGERSFAHIPKPDIDTIDSFIKYVPKEVRIYKDR